MSIAYDFSQILAKLVVAVALATAGCSTTDNRTFQERTADEAIGQRVEVALSAESELDADHVTVEVIRGVVIVSGLVGDADDLRSVLHVCYSVPGVVRVNDQLEIFDFGHDDMGAEGYAH